MTGRQICLAAELESLAKLRAFIEQICKHQTGIDDQIIYDLKLASDEACTNIITHGYQGMNPGSIILNLELTPAEVILTITDFGHPFEPTEAPMPDVQAGLEDRPTGGFGLYFIYQTMDKVDYKSTEDGNHLILVKNLGLPLSAG
ncbi:MAG TPA: ATP-binding protein [Anaerolineales bacterium]|nr:ATP-binding protein [Anaerolineales bacterium]